MSLDYLGIADALATKYASLTVGTAVTGGTAVRGATARTPNNIANTPYVIVELPEGDLTAEDSGIRRFEHKFDVYFLHSPMVGDVPRDKVTMLVWLGTLLGALQTSNKLGLGGSGVMKSRTTDYEYFPAEYGGDKYHAWHLSVSVWTEETFVITP